MIYSKLTSIKTHDIFQLWQRWGDADKIQKLFPDNPELAYRSDSLIEGTKRDTESYFILKLVNSCDCFMDWKCCHVILSRIIALLNDFVF